MDWLADWGSIKQWTRFHALMALVWVINLPLAIATPLKTSIIYLVIVSLLTAFSGEMAALHGSRVEEKLEGES